MRIKDDLRYHDDVEPPIETSDRIIRIAIFVAIVIGMWFVFGCSFSLFGDKAATPPPVPNPSEPPNSSLIDWGYWVIVSVAGLLAAWAKKRELAQAKEAQLSAEMAVRAEASTANLIDICEALEPKGTPDSDKRIKPMVKALGDSWIDAKVKERYGG